MESDLQLPDYTIDYRPTVISINNFDQLKTAVEAYAAKYQNLVVSTSTEKLLSLEAYMRLDGVHIRLYYFIVVVKHRPWFLFWLLEAVQKNGRFAGLRKFAQSSWVLETAFWKLGY